MAGGAGALGHWRLSSAPDPDPRELAPLRDAYRAYTLEAAVREAQLADAARVLEEAGVPALLGKGWAVARHYARPALRPYGDLDFFVAET
ncbi:MAG TPA: nucleotidyltransferase family protein, partial [Vicinamibacteria bacterium]